MAEASPSAREVDDQQPQDGGGCSLDRGKAVRKYTDIPAKERLTYPRGSKLDRLYATTPKPHGLVPTRFMPFWPELSADIKLPILPAPKDLFEISRGEVGTGLYRPAEDFTLSDPQNKELVVTSPYNALHDPHAKAHFDRSYMRNYILKQKLIFLDGFVKCDTKEFDDHRRYLNRRIYTGSLNKGYSKMDKIVESQKEQVKRMRQDVSKAGAVFKAEQTTMRAKAIYATKMDQARKRFEATTAYNQFRSQAHAQMLAEQRGSLILKGLAHEAQVKAKVVLLKAADESRRISLLAKILDKEKRAVAFIKSEKIRKCQQQEECLIDWLSVRCEAQKRQIEQAAETKKSVAATLKRRAMNRQIKIDNARATINDRLAAREAENNRIWALVRKYFYRWLDNVRKRRARRPDEFHRSFWQLQSEMETTVTYLRKESGYEKFDEFIMNIVKLKRDIKAEIESEEDAEVAAALGISRRSDAGVVEEKVDGPPPPADNERTSEQTDEPGPSAAPSLSDPLPEVQDSKAAVE